MKPIEIACRHQNPDFSNCGADAGEPCKWALPPLNASMFHACRIEDAAGIGQSGGKEMNEQEFKEAVLRDLY